MFGYVFVPFFLTAAVAAVVRGDTGSWFLGLLVLASGVACWTSGAAGAQAAHRDAESCE